MGNVLRNIRQFHHATLTELASEFDISQGYLSDIERNLKEPTLDILSMYAKKFDLPLYGLLFLMESNGDPALLKKFKKILSKSAARLIDHLADSDKEKTV